MSALFISISNDKHSINDITLRRLHQLEKTPFICPACLLFFAISSSSIFSIHASISKGSEYLKPSEPSANFGVRNVSTMPAPKKLVQSLSNGMLPPLPRDMPPPPPPPKFPVSTHAFKGDVRTIF